MHYASTGNNPSPSGSEYIDRMECTAASQPAGWPPQSWNGLAASQISGQGILKIAFATIHLQTLPIPIGRTRGCLSNVVNLPATNADEPAGSARCVYTEFPGDCAEGGIHKLWCKLGSLETWTHLHTDLIKQLHSVSKITGWGSSLSEEDKVTSYNSCINPERVNSSIHAHHHKDLIKQLHSLLKITGWGFSLSEVDEVTSSCVAGWLEVFSIQICSHKLLIHLSINVWSNASGPPEEESSSQRMADLILPFISKFANTILLCNPLH